jgi:hypothetical protein
MPFKELIYWQFQSNWQFQFILIACRPFWSPFQSFWSISIILIYFDLFWFWHQNCQNISIGLAILIWESR